MRYQCRGHATLNVVAQDARLTGYPGDGWQQRTLPLLAGMVAEDARISDFQVHGSVDDSAVSVDRWSDLDLLITAADPVMAAENFAYRVGCRLSPVFAANRSGNSSRYCVRLVLRDLRRIDVTAVTAAGGVEQGQRPTAPGQQPADVLTELIGSFQFDAVLAAVKAARGDVLIGAHLTLQLARQVLVVAMLLRDRDAGTAHHRCGGSRWDTWASRFADAPSPCTPVGITKAIRFYARMLDDIAAHWVPQPQIDNDPLLTLLDAIDEYGATEAELP